MFSSLTISASGLTAERLRLDVVSENLAAQDAVMPNGKPFARQVAILQATSQGGVAVTRIATDPTPGPVVYDPASPFASAQGFVKQSNVNPVQEMTDLLEATRSYQANVTAFDAGKTIAADAAAMLA